MAAVVSYWDPSVEGKAATGPERRGAEGAVVVVVGGGGEGTAERERED